MENYSKLKFLIESCEVNCFIPVNVIEMRKIDSRFTTVVVLEERNFSHHSFNFC